MLSRVVSFCACCAVLCCAVLDRDLGLVLCVRLTLAERLVQKVICLEPSREARLDEAWAHSGNRERERERERAREREREREIVKHLSFKGRTSRALILTGGYVR